MKFIRSLSHLVCKILLYDIVAMHISIIAFDLEI